jgi:tetratricopeptide (TPR) repeat protein
MRRTLAPKLALTPMLALVLVVRTAIPQGADHGAGHNGDAIRCTSGKPEVAVSACTNIFQDKREDDGKRAIALRNRAFRYQQLGDFDHAIADYEAHALNDYGRALALDPKLVSTYINRAAIYIKRGEDDRAITDLDRAALLDPRDSAIFVSRGTIYSRRGDQARAIPDFTQAIQLDPANATAWRNRSFANRASGDKAAAAADAAEAIRLNPNLAAAHFDFGAQRAGAGSCCAGARRI